MPTKKQLLIVAAISLAGTILSPAEESSLVPAGTTVEFDEMSFSTEKGKQAVRGNVVVSIGDLDLRTHELIYDAGTQTAEIPYPAALTYNNMRFVTTNAKYFAETQNVVATDARGGALPMFLQGGKIKATGGNVHIDDSRIFFGEPHWSTVSIDAATTDYYTKEDYFHSEDVTFRIGGFPVMYLPALTAPRFDRPPIRGRFRAGRESPAGEYFQTTTFVTLWDKFEPGMLLDFYTSSGLLVGPAFAYNVDDKDFLGGFSLRGEIQTGYINDTANRSDDMYGNSTTGPRKFVNWFHKQETGGAEISASIHYWSDGNVMRNFREEIYDENQNPDNYVEFVLPDERFYFSAIARMNVNDFQNTQQRLPELRIDFMPTEIAETNIFQRGFVSYAYLREENSDYYVGQTNDGDDLISSRADLYYGLDCPIKFGDVATLTPVAGVRLTYYGETVPAHNDDYLRALGQVGFDLHFLATGTFEYENETWGIDGLKHVFRPVFKYRYFPGSRSQSSRIPQIDREIYYPAVPTILDLADNRAIDQIYDEQVFRFGVENFIRTRDSKYGSKDLLSLSIYQDIRSTSRPVNNKTWSDNFILLEFSPTDFLRINAAHRADVYDGFKSKAFSLGVTLTDGDLWSVSLHFKHVSDPDLKYYGTSPISRQYTLSAEYKLNSCYTIYAAIEYDDKEDLFTKQRYGIRQRLGDTWLIDYYFRYRQHAGDDDSYSFNVSATLVLF